MRSLLLVIIAGCVVGCASEMLEHRVTERYWEDPLWVTYETFGDTPGHGDTFRVIYANPFAQEYRGSRVYPEFSVVVKEVYSNNGGRRGDLQVVEVMRRVGELTGENGDYYDRRLGWQFGATSTRNGEESDVGDFCWRRCHVNAPVAGAWFDYSKWAPVVP